MRSEDAKRSVGANLRTPGVATVRTVFAMVAANAATQFAIQAWMSYRFAKDVWVIPRPLCLSIIVALDLFAVSFMVFTYLLRTASRPARAYVWSIFAVGVGAQLFAAELYGAHEHWETPVRIFAGLPALFLAASLHGLIIWRNHASAGTPPAAAPRAVTPPAALPAEAPAAPPAAAPPARTPPTARRPRSVTPSRAVLADRDVIARKVVEQGERPADLAPQVGVSKRSIESWVKDYRERHTPRLGDFNPGPLDGIPDQHVNGAAPEIEVGT